ncbi:MAG: flagellar basal body rod protein FlgB [Desulfobulbus propionicus]|nr:MAG: flagellar basal body rod protein FlgB [Desulfobulbus propionicus]
MAPVQQFDTSMILLQKVLDLRAKNQQVIGSNIANAETPGYSAKSFTFEEQLHSAVNHQPFSPAVTHPNHIPLGTSSIEQVQGVVQTTKDNTGIGDENSVSVDQEMVKLSENQIMYEAATTMLKKKMALLKYTINGGS